MPSGRPGGPGNPSGIKPAARMPASRWREKWEGPSGIGGIHFLFVGTVDLESFRYLEICGGSKTSFSVFNYEKTDFLGS